MFTIAKRRQQATALRFPSTRDGSLAIPHPCRGRQKTHKSRQNGMFCEIRLDFPTVIVYNTPTSAYTRIINTIIF